ncbi:MAG: hypothetical protein HYX75_15305 [Acidobacteria bacterium]|nr:hypothetical protein [Acidobacteriota bacterium]
MVNSLSAREPAALIWCFAFGIAGIAMAFLYPDSYMQDGGQHFLQSRWAWAHPPLFVSVWGRPLFTFLYAFPAVLGLKAAKLFTVAVCVATAWQTWRLAREIKLDNAALIIPILFLQPSFLLLCADTLTEPLFALIFVVALRLHLGGRVAAGMLVAGTMILVRPDGLFLGVLWGIWVLLDRRAARPWWRRIPITLLLATGMAAWWLAALVITGDPLWILTDWPPDWKTQGLYGTGPIWSYALKMPDVIGALMLVPFALGLVLLLRRRTHGTMTSSFLCLFLLHSIMRAFAIFNEAGYARYFVCVAPATALITLIGWNTISGWLARLPRIIRLALASAALLLSGLYALRYVDRIPFPRDPRAIDEMASWFTAHPRPFTRMIWSHQYMPVALDYDPWIEGVFSAPRDPDDDRGITKSYRLFWDRRDRNLAILRATRPGTLVFWDDSYGKWFDIYPADFEAAGFTPLRSESYALDGHFFRSWTREMTLYLFYR